LVQLEAGVGMLDIDIDRGMWIESWQGSRPGATNERFWLFQGPPHRTDGK
jgi:hypothetical protein